jgi:hypothetical protein
MAAAGVARWYRKAALTWMPQDMVAIDDEKRLKLMPTSTNTTTCRASMPIAGSPPGWPGERGAAG